MSDLGFAIDDLYASGWWPASGDRCIQYDDGRWYPDESLIGQYFAQSIAHPKIKPTGSSHTVEVHWYSPTSGQHSVLGRSRTEAMILAFTSLYRESQAMQKQL
ncbi:MAG: hypothetical protein P1U42_02770 [Phycisphaerales bacterium]|nr:hypothetical protein [Phycisphaerales bacterium]